MRHAIEPAWAATYALTAHLYWTGIDLRSAFPHQSQRDCVLQPSGCDEGATLGKRAPKTFSAARLAKSAIHFARR